MQAGARNTIGSARIWERATHEARSWGAPVVARYGVRLGSVTRNRLWLVCSCSVVADCFFWCSEVFSLPGGRDGLGWPLRMTIPRVPGRAHHCCGQPLEWGSFRAPSPGEAVRELCACGGIS